MRSFARLLPHGDLIKPPYTLFEVQQGQRKSQRTVGGSGV
ncbi:hypothetical protein HDG37_002428 [Paraburkholderia sp. MM5384-R2]|nr:hypothetical protein [Paraburkholderia sp. MM5384-R2]